MRPVKGRTLAAIDIGSNSIKLRVARREGNRVAVLWDTTEICHLGRGFVDGCIPEETLCNAAHVVIGMVRCARDLGAERIRLVGTMALRVARNAGDFLNRIRIGTGLDVQIISGMEEARYSWKGAVAGLVSGVPDKGELVMFDTGGGSTEFVFGSNATSVSVPVGAVTLTERFFGDGPVRQSVVDTAVEHIKGMLNEYGIARRGSGSLTVVGLGGGVVAMASVKRGQEAFIPVELHGTTLTRRDLRQQIRLYSLLTLEERRNVVGLPSSRADVILGSACIVLCALAALDAPACTLSINGLRHGVLLEMFEEETEKSK
ncbi:MAG: Ppx/GppA family phosphatase [Synergistaceae bacterium]|nr:Ppx/GppA family phosphatase [Synergistaceae bacterium]